MQKWQNKHIYVNFVLHILTLFNVRVIAYLKIINTNVEKLKEYFLMNIFVMLFKIYFYVVQPKYSDTSLMIT